VIINYLERLENERIGIINEETFENCGDGGKFVNSWWDAMALDFEIWKFMVDI
jgi:hypothetical protein